jgi:hypothetical protein
MNPRGVAAACAALTLAIGISATTASAAPADDDTIAEAGLLTLADFPATEGWQTGSKVPDEPSTLPACAAVRRARERAADLRTPSPTFERADGTAAASNVVYVFPKASDAKRFLSPFRQPRYVHCLRQSTAAQLGDADDVEVDVTSTADVPGLGDQSVAFTITLSTGGVVEAVLQATAVRTGRVVDGFTLRSIEGPVTFGDSLVATSLGRVQQALAAA